jgi:nucleoside phosphorylase
MDEVRSVEETFAHMGWDMEAAAVNLVAHLNMIPCNVIKGVLDRHGEYDRSFAKQNERKIYDNSYSVFKAYILTSA